MCINGLQKLTLLDFPGKTACTVFTGGCNMRCPFCHNASLVLRPGEQETMTEEDFFAFLKSRRGLLDGVCCTGGEPTLQPDLPGFLAKIKDLGFAVKLDTNGLRPDALKSVTENGFTDYVAMDIKSSRERYPAVSGICESDVALIEESASILMRGDTEFEFRTTVVRELHSEEDFESIGIWLSGAPRFFLQQFKDSGDLIGAGYSAYSESEMEELLKILQKNIPSAQLRGVG